jgi:Family of unknown function (DUF6958)
MPRKSISRKGKSESAWKTGDSGVAASKAERVELENVNHPGHLRPVDAEMYYAMVEAFRKVLPKTSPGLTVAQIQERVLAHLPNELFPQGAKSGWWSKAVQLDLEAKGTLARDNSKPLRLHKT